MTKPTQFLQSIGYSSLFFGISQTGQVVSTWWKADETPPRCEWDTILETELAKVSKDGQLSIGAICDSISILICDYTVSLSAVAALEIQHGARFESAERAALEASQSEVSAKECRALDFLRNCPVTSAEDAVRILLGMSQPDFSDPLGSDVRQICAKALTELDRENWAKEAA